MISLLKLTFELYWNRNLDITGCPVTDAGIKGLCSNDYAGYETEYETRRMGQCKLLHSLKMKKTKVTKIGVEVALENLTK